MIVRPNDTLVLALDVEVGRSRHTSDDFKALADELEDLLGNNIRVIPLVGLKESFIVRSDET